MNEPKVLTRMRLSCCWGDNLNEKELNEVVDYINKLQNNWNELKKWLEEESNNTIYATGHLTALCMTLNKMKELEQGKDE